LRENNSRIKTVHLSARSTTASERWLRRAHGDVKLPIRARPLVNRREVKPVAKGTGIRLYLAEASSSNLVPMLKSITTWGGM